MKAKHDLGYDSRRFLKALTTFTKEAERYVQAHEELRKMGMDLIGDFARYERSKLGASLN